VSFPVKRWRITSSVRGQYSASCGQPSSGLPVYSPNRPSSRDPPEACKKKEIDQILSTTARRSPRQRVGVQLLRHLLLLRNCPKRASGDSGKLEPASSLHGLEWLHHGISDPHIQVKAGKDSRVHSSFHGIPSASIGRPSRSFTGERMPYTNQSPSRRLAAFSSISWTIRLASPSFVVGSTPLCSARSISTVARAVLIRSSSAYLP